MLVWVALLHPSARAQEEGGATLAVRVLELGSGLPAACNVLVGEETVAVDARGEAVVAVVPGEVRLSLSCEEHLPLDAVEVLQPGQRLEVTYRVARRSSEEITIYGEPVREEVSRKVISVEELTSIPGAFGDPIRALQSLPGVARPNTAEGDLVVRGAEGDNTRATVEEMPVPFLFHWFIGRSVINGALIDDVEFYPGGMPSRFGDVTQAVVNARIQNEQPPPGIHGRVSADLLDVAASSEASIGSFDVEVGGRYSWVGGLIGVGSRIASRRAGLEGFEATWVAPRYFDYTVRGTTHLGPHRLTLLAMGARDALILHPGQVDADGDGEPDPVEEPDLPYDPNRLLDSYFHRLQARWEVEQGMRRQSTWVAFGPDVESNLIEGLGPVTGSFQFGRVGGADLLIHRDDVFPLGDRSDLRTGLRTQIRPVVVQSYADVTSADDEIPTTRDTQLQLASWLEYHRRRGPWWVAPGMRGSVYSFNDQRHAAFEPRLSASRTLSDHWTGTAFVGRFTQVPPADRYAEAIGNPNLTLMGAWQTSVGAVGRWPSGIEVDLTAYATAMQDVVVKDERVEIRRHVDPEGFVGSASSELVTVFSAVDGAAFGVEGLLRARPSEGWFGWVGVTVSRALRFDENRVIPGDYDQPLALTLVGRRTFPREWRVSGRFRATSGHPLTPLHGAYEQAFDGWTAIPGEPNSERYPWFRQLDVRVDKTWVARRARWTFYVDVYNALNTKNFLFASYNPNYTELVPVLWIPVVPTLGLEVAY